MADGQELSVLPMAVVAQKASRAGAAGSTPGSGTGAWLRRERMWISTASMLGVLLAGCEAKQSVDNDMYIIELEAQVTQLQSDLNAAYQEVSRLSGNLSTQVTSLEGSMNDLNLRILDLPAATDAPAAIREVEAGMAVAIQRVGDVRATTDALADYLQ